MPNDTLCSTSYIPAQARKWLWRGRIAHEFTTAFIADPAYPGLPVAIDVMARKSAGAEQPDSPAPFAPGRILVIARDSHHWQHDLAPRLEAAGADFANITYAPCDSSNGARIAIAMGAYDLVVLPDPGIWIAEVAKDDGAANAQTILRHAAMVLTESIRSAASHPAALVVAEPPPGSNGTGRAQNLLRGQPHVPHAFRIGGKITGPYILESQRPPSWGTVLPLACSLELAPGASLAHITWSLCASVEAMMAWLSDLLAAGPLPASEVIRLAEIADLHNRTLYRAKRKLGIISRGGPGSTWRLPGIKVN